MQERRAMFNILNKMKWSKWLPFLAKNFYDTLIRFLNLSDKLLFYPLKKLVHMFNLILTSDNILFYLIDTIVQGSQSYSNLERNIKKYI